MSPIVITVSGGDEIKREVVARELYDHLARTRRLNCEHVNCIPEEAQRLDENYLDRQLQIEVTAWPLHVQTSPGPDKKRKIGYLPASAAS